jgi:hypothetical protein
MKRFLWLSFLLLCSGRLVAGQGGMLKPAKAMAQGNSLDPGVTVEAGPTGCLVEKNGAFRLRGQGFLYILKGHEKELAGHDGDEVHVTGTMVLPQGVAATHSSRIPTIKVKTVEILHDNNPAGKAPALGPVAGRQTTLSPLYGLRFRVPGTFTDSKPFFFSISANFVDPEGGETLGSFAFPSETYENTNFRGGSFAVFVNPRIHSEGACSAFRDFLPKASSSVTFREIRFALTLLGSGAAGSQMVLYYFHTYQNGLCYEFNFDFDESDSTGWDFPLCAVQWIYRRNERQLTDALLSNVRFVKPRFQPAKPAKPRPMGSPIVTSFTQAPVPNQNVPTFRFTWSTEGADYVQIHFPLISNIVVQGNGFSFYDQKAHNFPPSGHADLLLGNYSKSPVTLQFSVEPFRAGVAYPKQSDTLTLTLKRDH